MLLEDDSAANSTAVMGAGISSHQPVRWRCHTHLAKFHADEYEAAAGGAVSPYEVVEVDGNLLMYGGASLLWQAALGNGGSGALAYLNNANAHIGVGSSSTAEAATQTDLQATTLKLRRPMDGTYPQHTDGTVSGSATITFRATFGSGDANFEWAEWSIHNALTAGRMINRKVQALGTKSAAGVWQLTITLTLA